MVHYETLILAVPEITADETAALEKQFEQVIKKNNGEIRSFERWGKYRLAYPVRHNDYGVYYLVRFDENEENVNQVMKDLHSLFTVKYPQLVMRYMNTHLAPDQSLEYVKPESLEDIPSQDVDTFLRENKMEGLLKTDKPSTKRVEAGVEEVEANEESIEG
jgi:small subunit ribosomal protein S6